MPLYTSTECSWNDYFPEFFFLLSADNYVCFFLRQSHSKISSRPLVINQLLYSSVMERFAPGQVFLASEMKVAGAGNGLQMNQLACQVSEVQDGCQI